MTYLNILKLITTLSVTMFGTASYAQISSAVSIPGSAGINARGNTSLTIRYRIRVNDDSNGRLIAAPGQLIIDGRPVATLGRQVTRRVAGDRDETVQIVERINISRGQAQLIAKSTRGAVYRRNFNAGGNGAVVDTTLFASSSGAASLVNVNLSFDSKARYSVVDFGAPLSARAEVSIIGRGVIDGRWEIAEPGTGFRRLSRVRRIVGGGRRLVLESPDLPTNRPGIYIVRFVPTRGTDDTGLPEIYPEIKYSVQPGGGAGNLTLRAPQDGSSVSTATVFSWRATSGATLYRLEFLTGGAGSLNDQSRRVAAVDLPAGNTSARLKPFTLARIKGAGARIYWRVLALDAGGTPLATSTFRSFGNTR